MKILLIVSGTVGIEMFDKIVSNLQVYNADIKAVVSNHWKGFSKDFHYLSTDSMVISRSSFDKVDNVINSRASRVEVFDDEKILNEFKFGNRLIIPLLSEWADVMLVCPCSPNLLSSMVNASFDNACSESIASFLGTRKPIYIAPAMDSIMWGNPFVKNNLRQLRDIGVNFFYPTVNHHVNGTFGIGAIADLSDIAKVVCMKTVWTFPLDIDSEYQKIIYRLVPVGKDVGAFGALRKNYIHTGVDLLCNDGQRVVSVEDGEIVKIGTFTGPDTSSPHLNETMFVVVKGESGYILYGGIGLDQSLLSHREVKAGELIGMVVPVRHAGDDVDFDGSMLHLELYNEFKDPLVWEKGNKRPSSLKDPTIFLRHSRLLSCR